MIAKLCILWDTQWDVAVDETDEELNVQIDGDSLWITEDVCDCNPAAGAGCGGCVTERTHHKIGDGRRFVWRKTILRGATK